MLLFYAASSDRQSLRTLAKTACEGGKFNVAFEAAFMVGDAETCLQILITSKRLGEAAVFAKAYIPSRVEEVQR